MTGSPPGGGTNDLMRFAHLGALGAVAIVGGFFLGRFLDEWLATSPFLMLGLAFAGAAGWMMIVVREASTVGRRSKKRRGSTSRKSPSEPPASSSEPPDERA